MSRLRPRVRPTLGFFRFLSRLPASERGLTPQKLDVFNDGKRAGFSRSPRADSIASLSGKFFLYIDTMLVRITFSVSSVKRPRRE